MSFSEFQYSNRQAFPFTVPSGDSGETWTKEEAVSGITFRDKVETGRQLTVTMSNPQNIHGSKYSAFKRVRVIDRPSNAVLFIGRIVDAQNDHRKQLLTLICLDYVADLGDKTVPSANLYGNRRSDVAEDVISGGSEYGRTVGIAGRRNLIFDSTKNFTKKYVGRVVKVGGRGPGLVTGVTGSVITDSSATGVYVFDDSFIDRLIRKVTFEDGRKKIKWEGRVTAVPASTQLTITATGVDTRLSGGKNYTSVAHLFASGQSPAHYWEIVGYEGTITKILTPTLIQCSTVGSTSSASYAGYKDANFLGWGANTAVDGTINGKLGGVDYAVESAEDGVFQSVAGQSHTSDKSIDWKSRVDKSPYLEYTRKSYGQGQASSEGVRETLQKIARDEVWETPQVLFFGGHLDSGLGVAENDWMLGSTEVNTGVDLLLKPTKAPLPLQTRVTGLARYITGTAIQDNGSGSGAGNTVTGSNTIFTTAMIGSLFTFDGGGGGGIISAVGSTTSLTVATSATVSSGSFIIDDGNYNGNVVVNNKNASSGLSSSTIYFSLAHTTHSDPAVQLPGSNAGLLNTNEINTDTVGSPATVGGTSTGFWDPTDLNKNLIQIGDEVRRVVSASTGELLAQVTVETPFDNIYIYSDDVYVGIGPYVGSPRWEQDSHSGGAPTASQSITGKEDLVSNGTFYGNSKGGWTSAASGNNDSNYGGFSSVDVTNAHAYVTTDTTRDGMGVLTTIVEGIEEGKTYRLTLEVARDITGGTTNRTANDADEKKVWISSLPPYFLNNAWNSSSYTILNSDDMKSSNLAYSNSNRDAWIQYHFEFVAPAGLANDSTGTAKQVYVSLVAGTTANPVISTLTANASNTQSISVLNAASLFSVGDTVTIYDAANSYGAAQDRKVIPVGGISGNVINFGSNLAASYTATYSVGTVHQANTQNIVVGLGGAVWTEDMVGHTISITGQPSIGGLVTEFINSTQLRVNTTSSSNFTPATYSISGGSAFLRKSQSGKKARFDSIQLRERFYDSRLYIGSPKIFNGIKFDLETSTDTYQGMILEFWGRDRRDGTFGWHSIEDYHVDDAQTGDLQYRNHKLYGSQFRIDAVVTNPNTVNEVAIEGVRGIDDFNLSGTIKWWDIGFRDGFNESSGSGDLPDFKYTSDWESPPNTPWNHWPKDNLRNTEPDLGSKVNTLSTTKHNYSGAGGVPVTGLDDPAYSNLYWVRLSVPSNESTGKRSYPSGKTGTSPGFIKNLRILDGRKSSRDEDDTPLYDTTERSLSNAQWDWRVEDPGFFSVIGQVDTTSPSTTLSNSTTTSEAIVHAEATKIDNSDVSSTSTIDSSNRLIVGAASVKVDPTTVSTTLDGAIAHTQTTLIDGAIGAATGGSADLSVGVDANEQKTTLNGAILHDIDTTLDGGINNSVTSATVNPTTTKTTLIASIAHSYETRLDGGINNSQQTLVVDDLSANLAIGRTILIDSEQMYISGVNTSNKTLSVNREQNGTTAASHDTNDLVYVLETYFNVVSSSGLNGATLKIDNEEVTVQSIYNATVLVVLRGQNGTSVAGHSNGSAMLGLPTTLINGATILIDSEQMAVTSVNIVTHVIGITREVNGTSAVLHDNADNVYVLDTTIAVASNANLATNQLVKVDSEFMQVTDRGSNTLTVKRGQNSSAVAAHSNASAPVLGIPSAFTATAPNNTVLVGAEQMTVGAVSITTNTLTVTRQVNNTSEPGNNTHADNSPIYILDTTIPVASSSGLNGLVVQVGTENMNVTGVNGNILTVVRGHGRSTVASHANSGSAAQVRTGVPASLATGVTALIGAEQMTIGTVTAATSTIAVTRAQNNTTAAIHNDGVSIYALDLTVPVNSLLSMVVGSVIRIGSEDLQISSILDQVLTVVRGHNSTAVANYNSGVAVSLLGDTSAAATTIKVASAANLTLGHVIKIGTEEMDITAISGTTLTVTRGFGNTTAATHTTGAAVTSFHVWDDFTSDMTSLSKTASMEGFSTSFRNDNKYIYFGADYKFSGIEFNLRTNGSTLGPAQGLIAEYWNGVTWVAVQDLYSYDFSSSGSMRWDMDTIDGVESQVGVLSDYSSNYFEPKYQWKKRDLRTSTNTWGGYNYDTTGSGAAKATRNPYIPPNTTEVITTLSPNVTTTSNIDKNAVTFTVNSSTNLRKGHWIQVVHASIAKQSEFMLITGISGTTLTVRRGQLSTPYQWYTASGTQLPTGSVVKTVQPIGGAPFGDGSGAYPAGVGSVNSLDAPHNHLYWMRLRVDGAGAIAIPAVITTIRMFSRPVLKYFERGTEPWNFHLTGTEEATSVSDATSIYGLSNKFEFNDANGRFVRSPSNPNVNNSDAFIKNISAADYTYTNSGVLSASRVGLQPALRQGGVGATGEATVVTTLDGAINNLPSTTTVVVDDGSGIEVNDYILIDLERMMVTAKSDNTLTVIRGVHSGGDFWGPTINVVLNANAAAAQRVVAMATTTGFSAGNSVRIYDNNTPAGEAKVIASGGVTSTTITVTTDLANAYTTAASAGILRTEPADTIKNYFTSVEANHAHESDVSVLPRTTDLHEKLHLSAGLFVPGFTASNYQGATGSKYLFYQDKVVGVKTYEVYGGDTSSTGNWHGLRIIHDSNKTNQNFPLYRYSINEVPANVTTRVTVNGQDPISFTAIDEESETLYGLKKEKVIYDRNIKSKTEAESTAESLLLSSKPTTTQTIKQATLEFYEFPVYKFNSATTTSVNRDIPRVLRAGDIIQLTLNDGNYKFTNVPFLVQGLDYDDKKSLTKLSCTERVFPTTTDMFNIADKTYAAAKQARDTAQQGSVPTSTSSTTQSFSKTGDPKDVTAQLTATKVPEGTKEAETSLVIQATTYSGEVNEPNDAAASSSTSQGFDGVFKSTIGLHHHQGAISFAGDTEDIQLGDGNGTGINALVPSSNEVDASGEDVIVLSKASTFVARDGGFTPSHVWRGRTVVLNPTAANETTYTITEVKDEASIRVDGGHTWIATDEPVIRKISSALKNPSISDSGTTTYYDLDQKVLRARIGNQLVAPSSTDYPVWGTNFAGFHGTKATDANGVVIVDLVADHGAKQLLTHKPVVIATVDPTDLSGDENTGAVQAAYVVVQKYTTVNAANAAIAQTGYAAAGSTGSTLVAQGGNSTDYSKFASGLVGVPYNIGAEGDTVFRYDAASFALLDSGYVTAVTNAHTLTTSFKTWAVGNIYVIHAQIRRIHLKVYYPSLSLAAGATGATESVLVNAAGTQFYTSDSVARTVSTATPAVAGIGVHYVIIPKANRIDNLPFNYGGKGND